jgi:hypothetical protein
MKHENPDIMELEARPLAPEAPPMDRRARIARWAACLEAHEGPLAALRRIEFMAPELRRAYRDPASPLTVAFNDPVLRQEGLAGDTLGDVMDFFEMTHEDTHRLLCDCHYHGTMTGPGLAGRLRQFAGRREAGTLWQRAQNVLSGRA